MNWASQWYMNALVALGCLGVLAAVPSLLRVLPSLVQSLLWVKVHQRLCISPNLRISRDIVAASLFLPWVMLAARYSLHPLILQTSPIAAVGSSALLWLSFLLLRTLLNLMMRGRLSNDAYICTSTLPRTIFAAAVPVVLLTVGAMSFFGASDAAVRASILCESAVFYALCLVRRYQIFTQYRGYFSGFLYLCTLEFFPTGILVGSAAFF